MENRRPQLEAEGPHDVVTALSDLSESFQEFVRPLLEQLPLRFRLLELRDPLMIAGSVWNQVIDERGDLGAAVANVAQMIEEFQFEPVSPAQQKTLEALTARKWELFRDDTRHVVEIVVHRRGADVRVVVETRPPMPGMNAVLIPHFLTGGSRELRERLLRS